MMKVWITKYALTKGVFTCEATCCQVNERMIEISSSDGTWKQYHWKPDWHTTEDEALERVHQMIDAKIRSLENLTAKMCRMKLELSQKKLAAITQA